MAFAERHKARMQEKSERSVDSDEQQLWERDLRKRREPSDFCSREGASALKQQIEAYWQAKGAKVQVCLADAGFSPQVRIARFDVRSDMVNGLPRKHDRALGARSAQSVLSPALMG